MLLLHLRQPGSDFTVTEGYGYEAEAYAMIWAEVQGL